MYRVGMIQILGISDAETNEMMFAPWGAHGGSASQKSLGSALPNPRIFFMTPWAARQGGGGRHDKHAGFGAKEP